MCDPMSIIGIGLSIGMAAMQASAQQDMMDKQNAANDAWLAYQRRQANAENLRQESLRRNAEAAREGSLSELTPEKQINAQQNEQARLEKALTPQDIAEMASGNQQTLNDKLLSGQAGGAAYVTGNIKDQLATAAQQARARIAALAAVQSYGGSQFGLTNRANTIFNASGQTIRLAGDERQGSLAAYAVEKAVEPLKYVMGGTGGGGGGGSGAAGLMRAASPGLGSSMASMFSG
jgi:hypothetical protein